MSYTQGNREWKYSQVHILSIKIFCKMEIIIHINELIKIN